MPTDRITALFSVSAATLFVAAGIAKVVSAVGDSEILKFPDPVFGIKFGPLLIIVGLVEIVVGYMSRRPTQKSLLSLGCLASGIILYRIGLLWIGYRKPCGCLGTLVDILKLDPVIADNVMLGTVLYIFFGAWSCYFYLIIRGSRMGLPQAST